MLDTDDDDDDDCDEDGDNEDANEDIVVIVVHTIWGSGGDIDDCAASDACTGTGGTGW